MLIHVWLHPIALKEWSRPRRLRAGMVSTPPSAAGFLSLARRDRPVLGATLNRSDLRPPLIYQHLYPGKTHVGFRVRHSMFSSMFSFWPFRCWRFCIGSIARIRNQKFDGYTMTEFGWPCRCVVHNERAYHVASYKTCK